MTTFREFLTTALSSTAGATLLASSVYWIVENIPFFKCIDGLFRKRLLIAGLSGIFTVLLWLFGMTISYVDIPLTPSDWVEGIWQYGIIRSSAVFALATFAHGYKQDKQQKLAERTYTSEIN